jgi:hypothetical protein
MPANQTLQIGQVKQLTDKLTTENTYVIPAVPEKEEIELYGYYGPN